jgi:hypothetical protein
MDKISNEPGNQSKPEQSYNTIEPDVTPRREGGGDSIAESSPVDSRADEIVFVNEKTENLPPKIDTNKEENDTGNSNNNA